MMKVRSAKCEMRKGTWVVGVAQIFNLYRRIAFGWCQHSQRLENLHGRQIANLRYGRLQICATLALCGALTAGAEDFSKQHARTAPPWLRDGVVYEIFPRNFSAEGNFNGITAQLDRLKDLGVNVLWLMPIHPIGEKMRKGPFGSPYAVRDYDAINPDYGTAADLKRLVSEAHKRDLKVIIDIVANHTAWDSVLMAHPEFYKQDDKGKIIPPVKDWTDVAGLNYDSP